MITPLLDRIFSPEDIKELSSDDLTLLASEIRQRIISILSLNGGHLSSNLGIVELTIALHRVFDSPQDKFIFDTSHQTYTHKILTGRNTEFPRLRRYKGLAGFSHPHESIHDHFFSGHAGTALSSALGLAMAREKEEYILPILGDASLTCGQTYEALNNLPKDLKKFLIILNDNEMAICKNVGNIHRILQEPYPERFFQHFGLSYIGPVNGHDLPALIDSLNLAKNAITPTLVHVRTIKGKGLLLAKENPTDYHGAKPFDKITGRFFNSTSHKDWPTFSSLFGKTLVDIATKDPSLFAISPAMLPGSGLLPFQEKFPDRCLDVGIAENHALAFAGGLALKGQKKVVTAIYSTFLQRAFDNLFHDICLQEVPVIFGIDRAGLNGPDGVTHHGIYDIGFLLTMPGLIVGCPRNGQLLTELLHSSFSYGYPCAIRYPNAQTETPVLPLKNRLPGKAEILRKGKDLLILALGTFCNEALQVAKLLNDEGIDATVVDPIFLKPFDESLFLSLIDSHPYVLTLEEHALSYGFGMFINHFMMKNQLFKKVLNLGISDQFVQHGERELLLKELKLDPPSIVETVMENFFASAQKKTERAYDYCSMSQ